ncbi:MAG: hypothetical protein DRP68_03990 [Candidatus Omnitrophota bacterium]|nr:MAG: hypothetical protein DRP68_03990 [Candidatus Omnitrophota bacterium]
MNHSIRILFHKRLIKYISLVISRIIYRNTSLISRKEVNKILIISLDYIGDYIMRTIPIIFSIKKYFPQASISIMVGSWIRELASSNPFIDEIIVYNAYWLDRSGNKWNFIKKIKVLFRIWRRKFDLVVGARECLGTVLIGLLKYSRYRLGILNQSMSSIFYTNYTENKISSVFQIVNNLPVSVDEFILKKKNFICVSKDSINRIKELLIKKRLDFSKKIISIHPGANSKVKQWHYEKWAELCDAVVEKYDVEIVICGTNKDREFSNNIVRRVKNRVINLTGETTLMELVAMIKMSSLCITIDSGAMHIAGLLDIPLVALFGPNDPRDCGSLTNKCRIVYKNLPCVKFCIENAMDCKNECMRFIRVDDVLKEVEIIRQKYELFRLQKEKSLNNVSKII